MMNVAIIIPTKNRPEFVARACRWYKRCRLIVVDGSTVASPEPRCHYVHLPGSNENEAIAAGVRLATEPYCAIAGDDDFLVEPALIDLAFALDGHSQYDSARGIAMQFETIDDAPYGPVRSCVPHPDQVFRLYRREVLLAGAEFASNFDNYHDRGWWLYNEVTRAEHPVLTLDMIHLFRQGHKGRPSAGLKPRSWRERAGARFPLLRRAFLWSQVHNQCWNKKCCSRCALLLPMLRWPGAPHYDTFNELEHFLNQ